jgi:hypothetical protein
MPKIQMSIKKSLTKAHPHGMKKNVKASTTPRKNSLLPKTGIITLQGEKYYIVPKKKYDEIIETAVIMSDPEAYERLKKSFADPIKRRFSSIEEIRKDLDSDGDWE